MTDMRTIDELRAENAKLSDRLARYDRAAQWPLTPASFIPPTADELFGLEKIVLDRFKILRPKIYPDPEGAQREFSQMFVAAFRAISTWGRAAEPDFKKFKSYFVDNAEEVLRNTRDNCRTIQLAPFLAALIANSDIPFTPLGAYPYDLYFGLRLDGLGAPATDAWRRTLNGQFRAPHSMFPGSAPPARNVSKATVTGGDRNVGAGYREF